MLYPPHIECKEYRCDDCGGVLRIRASWDDSGWYCETCKSKWGATSRSAAFEENVKARRPQDGAGTSTVYLKFDAHLGGDGNIVFKCSGMTWRLSPDEAIHAGRALERLALHGNRRPEFMAGKTQMHFVQRDGVYIARWNDEETTLTQHGTRKGWSCGKCGGKKCAGLRCYRLVVEGNARWSGPFRDRRRSKFCLACVQKSDAKDFGAPFKLIDGGLTKSD